jgi:hypothetical protein
VNKRFIPRGSLNIIGFSQKIKARGKIRTITDRTLLWIKSITIPAIYSRMLSRQLDNKILIGVARALIGVIGAYLVAILKHDKDLDSNMTPICAKSA